MSPITIILLLYLLTGLIVSWMGYKNSCEWRQARIAEIERTNGIDKEITEAAIEYLRPSFLLDFLTVIVFTILWLPFLLFSKNVTKGGQ